MLRCVLSLIAFILSTYVFRECSISGGSYVDMCLFVMSNFCKNVINLLYKFVLYVRYDSDLLFLFLYDFFICGINFK